MRRCILALWLALALALTACAPGGGRAPALTVMGRRTDMEKSYMQEIFRRYEAATGTRLERVEIEDADYEAEAARRFAAGEGPDVFLHFHNADLERFDVGEDFYLLTGESWVDDLTDSARAYCQDSRGELLGLPFWESSVSGCYYNKTILDSLGLKAAATQAEFDELCQVLADLGRTPICWPSDGCSWMPQFALDPVFADDPALLERLNRGEVTYAQIPAVRSMAQWLLDAADRGWFGANYLSTGWDQIGPALASGDAVMTFIWDTWFYTDFQGGRYSREDFALMPVFMGTADGGTYEGGNLNMMMVNKQSPRLEEALDFLSFCATKENYDAAFDGVPTVSCFKGQTTNIRSTMVTDAAASIAEKERVSVAVTRIAGYSADDMLAAVNDLLLHRTDVDGALAAMDAARMAAAGLAP